MATTNSVKNPVFEELAVIQASFNKFPNPSDSSGSIKCRASISDGSRRCRKEGCRKDERQQVKDLFSEFTNMTDCPQTEDFHQKMEIFITYTHCLLHRENALKTFSEWKKGRTAAAASLPPPSPPLSPSISPSASPFSSSDDIFSSSMSQTSDTTSQTSFLGDSICAEPVSDYESDGAGENHTKNIAKETISAATTIKNVYFETHTKKGGHKIRYVMPGVGTVVSPRRMPSLRDHAPVFQVIYSHPGESMMQEGVVYIFKHMERPNLFKIGFSTKGAEERWRQSKCYGTDTEIIYETKRKFCGARQAEKIIQTWLCHQNVLIKSCVHCGGGHKEWFEAPREDIFKAVEAIEAFVQMPAYVQTDGVWKLSAEAYKIVGPMCHFDPPALLKGGCAVEKENKEAESPQVTPDATPSKDTEEADICENSDATGQNTLPKPPGDGGEVEEDSVTALIRQLFGKLQISVKAALEVKAEWTL